MHGENRIINSGGDQGSQFTQHGIHKMPLTRDKPSAWMAKAQHDNIFIERLWKSEVRMHLSTAFEDGVQLYEGLDNYFTLQYRTVHQSSR